MFDNNHDTMRDTIPEQERTNGKPARAGWMDIIGRHSVMLALEPRFMFDAAIGDTVAEVDSQQREAVEAAAGAGSGDSFETGEDGAGDGTDDDVKDPLESFGIDPLQARGGIGIAPLAAGVIEFDETGQVFDEQDDQGKPLHWEVGKIVDIDKDPNEEITVTITLDPGTLGKLTINESYYTYGDNTLVTVVGDVATGDTTVTITGLAKNVLAVLEGLEFDAETNWSGAGKITFDVDGESADLDFTVKPMNHLPELTVPGSNVMIFEDEWGNIASSLGGGKWDLALTDVDAGDELTVKIFADHTEAFRVGSSGSALAGVFDTVSGKWVYTFSGSQTDVNDVLSQLQYRGAKDHYGDDTITIMYQDREMGETVDVSNPDGIWKSQDLIIRVTGVNDDPVFDPGIAAGGAWLNGTVAEGGTISLTEDMFGLVDVEQTEGEIFITILEVPDHGVLQIYNGTAWVDLAVGSRFTYDQIKNAQGSNIRYVHGGEQVRDPGDGAPGEYHNLDGFKFNVNDGAGGFLRNDPDDPNSGVREIEFTLNLTPVNQDPVVTIDPSTDPEGDPSNPTEGYYTEVKPGVGTNPDGSPKQDVSISVFEDEVNAVIKFQISDADQIGDFLVYITELPDILDGYLSYKGQKLTAADFEAFGDGKSGIKIAYADVLAGMLTFTHSGKDGWNGSGFQAPGTENDYIGMTRNTGFKIVVVDDGGGAGDAARITTDPFDINITVKPNNDMPEYQNGLTEKNGETYHNASTDPAMGEGKDGLSYVDGTGGHWIIQLGGKNNNGGFRVTDDDSRAGEIIYTIENDMANGRIYIKTGVNQYKVLQKGDSFTQKQINAGDIYYIFSSAWGTEGVDYVKTTTSESHPEWSGGNPVYEEDEHGDPKENRDEFDQLVWTDLRDADGNVVVDGFGVPVQTQYVQKWTYAQGYYTADDKLKVTVRDGSYTAWVAGDNGTVHREGVEAGVGTWNGDSFVFTKVSVDFDLVINFGGPGKPIETGTILEIGSSAGQVPTANEGKSVALAGDGYSIVDIYYADKATHNKIDSESTDAIKCRVTEVPSNGKLVYRGPTEDGQGTIEREINQFDEFFYKDLKYIFYEHDGSETFTDSFVVSVSDGSLYLGDSEADSKLTVNLNIAPANDTPEVTPGEMLVDEGPESHQGGDDTFDRNGAILGPEHLGIVDQDVEFAITDGSNGTRDMYLRENGNKVLGHDGSYYTNVLKVGPDDKIVTDGFGKAVYFTETELRQYYSSDDATKFVVYEKPAYGDIWVYVGSGNARENGSGVDLDVANDDLSTVAGWYKLTDADYAGYAKTLENIYDHDPADWVSLGAYIFSKADLAAGRVRYVHNGQDTRDNGGNGHNDQIKIIVNDGQGIARGGEGPHQQSVAEMVTIEVKVKDVNDAPEMVKNDPVQTPEGGSYKPGYTPSGGLNDPNYGTTITNNSLDFYDAEQNPNNLKYQVTKNVEQGTVYLYRAGTGTWVALEKGSTFTQEDINNGYVKYVHNGSETHGIGDTPYDVLGWTLRDGDVNPDKWIDGQLKLEIMPSNNAPEIVTSPGSSGGKFREEDGYYYISDKNRVDQVNPADDGSEYYKDLGGLFQVKDRDYDDLSSSSDFKGIAEDKMEVTLTSSFTKNGAPASYTGKFWYDEVALTTPGVKIYVEVSPGVRTEITSLAQSGGKIIIVGTRDQVNEFLDALVYYSEPDLAVGGGNPSGVNEADLNAVLTIGVKVDDLANGAAMTDAERDQHNLTDTDSVKIWISTVNDTPVWDNSPDGAVLTTDEDTIIRVTGSGGSVISISDPDTFDTTNNTVKITLGPGKGTFVNSSGATYATTTDGLGNTVLEVTGSLKQINNILANLYYDPQGDWNGDANIRIEYTDCVPGYDPNTPRPGMEPFTIVADITVEVVPTNDAPTLVIPNGDQIQFIDGGATESDPSHWHNVGGGITVDDIDFNAVVDPVTGFKGTNVLEVTLTPNEFKNGVTESATFGKLRIDGKTSQAWVLDTTLGITMNADGSLVLKGTKDQINAALADLQYFAGQVGNGTEDLNLSVKISIHVDDLGNGHLSGTDPKQVDGSFFIMVGDKNDKPEIMGNGSWTVDEDGTLDFTGADKIYINDPDALDGYLTVTLKTVNGKLTLPDGTSLAGWNPGKEFVSVKANGTTGSLVTIYGTQAHINAILEGMKYTPKTDYNGTESMIVTSNDHGNTSATDGPATDSRTIVITINPVNDAPGYQSGSDKQVTIGATEDDKNVDATPGYTVNDLFTTTGSHTTSGKPALYQDNRDNSDASSAQGFKGIVVVGDASTAAQGSWQYKTSGGTWTDLPAVSVASGLFLAADTQIRFIPTGDYNGPAGKLTVHMVDSSAIESAAFVNGSTHDLTGGEAAGKTGGTTAVSKDTASINLNVIAVNDAPTITGGKETVSWGSISNKANDAANTGQTVSGLFGPSFSDQIDNVTGGSNADLMIGVVVVGSTGEAGKGQWQYHNGSGWVDIPAQAPGTGFYLTNGTKVRFSPDPDYSGAAPSLTVKLVDGSAANGASGDPHFNPAKPTANGPVDLSVVGGDTRYSANNVTLNVTIYEGDNSPVIESGKGTASGNMLEDGAPVQESASTVADFFSPSFNNGDKGLDKTTGFAGIVITECLPDANKGSWEYWNGGGWTTINVASAASALYLDAGTEVRFNPKLDYNGTAPTMKAHLVENKSGGGSPHTNGDRLANFDPQTRYDNNHEAPYTSGAVTLTMTVTPVNDAPDFQTGSDRQVNITATEDDKSVNTTPGYSVNDLFTTTGSHTTSGKPALYQDSRDNSDASSAQGFKGIVIVGDASTSTEGVWQYKTSGGTWTTLGPVSDADGLFLAADAQLRFIPTGDYNGPAGKLTVHMVDSSAESAAFVSGTNGYDVTGANAGGTTAVSKDTADINITVAPVNDAPTIVGGNETVSWPAGTISNKVTDAANTGQTVGGLFGPSFSDQTDNVTGGSNADAMLGVVVVGSTGEAGKGQWQYHDGSGWVNIPSQASGSGFYLTNGTSVRFNPDPDYSGAAPSLTVKLVDDSDARGLSSSDAHFNPAKPTANGPVDLSVVGGDTRYSANNVTLNVTIYEGDNSPLIESGKGTASGNMLEDGAPVQGSASTVADFFSPSFNNGDKGLDKTTGFAGIVITKCLPDVNKGSWEYWNGGGWTTINVASAASALYLDAGTEVRFNPKLDYNGTAPTMKAHLVENKSGGGSPHTNGDRLANFDPQTRYDNNHEAPYTSDAVTLTMTITPVNDAPDFQTGSDKQVNITATEDDKNLNTTPGYTVNNLFTTTGSHTTSGKPALYQDSRDNSDASSAQGFKGIVIVGDASTSTEGVWQYKTSGGTWTTLGPVSDANGLFLAADAQIRFIPAADYNGPAGKLTVHMVDSSAESASFVSGNNGYNLVGGEAAGKTGGTTAVSKDTADINLTVTPVNDAPTVVVGKESVSWPDGDISNKVIEANNPGNTVGSLFGDSFADARDDVSGGSSANGMLGVVVVGQTGEAGKGQWQYKVGGSWVDIPTQPGGKGFYLSNDTVIRFKPHSTYIGAAPELTVKLVDDSDARGSSSSDAHFNPAKPSANGQVDLAVVGGDTRYSADDVSLAIDIIGGNNSPVGNRPTLELTIDEDFRPDPDACQTVGDIFTGGSSPIFNNGEGTTDGFAGIVIVDCRPDAGKGAWQYWDAGANDWMDIDVQAGVDDPLFLSADTALRFKPLQDYNGAAPGMEVHLVENDSSGNPPIAANGPVAGFDETVHEVGHRPPYSQGTIQVDLTVRAINDAPTIGGIVDIPAVDEQTPVRIAPGGVLDDVELGVSEKDDWGGATLTIQRGDGAGSAVAPCPEDVFGADAGSNMVFGPDGKVYVSGTEVGSYANGGGVLSITFAAGVDTATANEVLQSLTYTYNRDDVPGGDGVQGEIDLVYVINDKNNGSATVEGGQGYGSALTASWNQKIVIDNVADEAVPVADAGEVDLAVSSDTGGNVLVNDAHKDYPAAFSPGDVLEVVKVDGREFPDVNNDGVRETLIVNGEYGTLVINPDGTYTYTVDPNSAKTKELVATGGTVTETFVYEAQAKSNADPAMVGSAELVITITAPVPPVSHIPNPERPGEPVVSEPSAPPLAGGGIGEAIEVEKPVNSTVNEAATNANGQINNSLDGLNNQFNPKPLPPSLDSPGGLKDAASALEEPTLIGNTDHREAEVERQNDFTLPEDLFVHSNRGTQLVYTASLPDGSPLPEWMEFDPESLAITCTPPAGAEGTMEVIISAEDHRGLRADATVNIKIGEAGTTTLADGSVADSRLLEDEEPEPADLVDGDVNAGLVADENVAEVAADSIAAEDLSGEENEDEDGGEQSESLPEEVDGELVFAGEWLRLEAEAASDGAAEDTGAHQGLRTQIAATGSDGIRAQARVLLESLLSI